MLARFLTYRNRRYKPVHASALRNMHRIISASELVYGRAETAEQANRSAEWMVAAFLIFWASLFWLAALGSVGAALILLLFIGPMHVALLAVGARASLIIEDFVARHGDLA